MVKHKRLDEFPNYMIAPVGLIYGRRWKYLKPNKRGYVILTKQGIRYTRHVGKLVLTAYIGPCPAGYHLKHQDGNRLNNRLGNLTWTKEPFTRSRI